MSEEAGSQQCRGLIEAKESLIKAMGSLSSLENIDPIQEKLREIYTELESIHEKRRLIENE